MRSAESRWGRFWRRRAEDLLWTNGGGLLQNVEGGAVALARNGQRATAASRWRSSTGVAAAALWNDLYVVVGLPAIFLAWAGDMMARGLFERLRQRLGGLLLSLWRS